MWAKCIAWNKKKIIYCLPQSQKNCTEKTGLIGNIVTQRGLVGRCETQLGPQKCVVLTISILPPPS